MNNFCFEGSPSYLTNCDVILSPKVPLFPMRQCLRKVITAKEQLPQVPNSVKQPFTVQYVASRIKGLPEERCLWDLRQLGYQRQSLWSRDSKSCSHFRSFTLLFFLNIGPFWEGVESQQLQNEGLVPDFNTWEIQNWNFGESLALTYRIYVISLYF